MKELLIHACVLTPESTFRQVQPANGITFTPEELIQIVQGHIKIVPLKGQYSGKVLVMTSNAEGRRLGLKFNPIASELANRPVLGQVLICERKLIQ